MIAYLSMSDSPPPLPKAAEAPESSKANEQNPAAQRKWELNRVAKFDRCDPPVR
jgi:hypothetical protein